MPSDKVLNKLYSGDYEFRVDHTAVGRFKATAKKVLDEFRNLNPSGETLLDIGAGYGTFVAIASAAGLKATGIEPANNLYKLANLKLRGKILHTDLNKFVRTRNSRYDFITLIHVIEHIKSPESFLKTLLRLLKPGGVLYVETPNASSHLVTFEKANYTFMTPPDHLNLFSKKSFEILVNKCDVDIKTNFSTYSYPEHLVGILRIIKRYYYLNNSINEQEASPKNSSGGLTTKTKLPFFDRAVAPVLTPLLNLGYKGSFLQIFVQKKN